MALKCQKKFFRWEFDAKNAKNEIGNRCDDPVTPFCKTEFMRNIFSGILDFPETPNDENDIAHPTDHEIGYSARVKN